MPYDAVIAGLGAMGGALAAHAAQRGLRVLGLEQFARGHDLGASSGGSRMLRVAYFEKPAYVPLVRQALESWRALEAWSGEKLFHACGVLLAGPAGSAVLAGARASAAEHGAVVEELSAPEIARRFPAFRPRPGEIGIFEPGAGFLIPERANAAHLRLAEAHGADLRFETPVEAWRAFGSGVEVLLAGGECVRAKRLALALGPWFDAFAGDLGVRLKIQRNVQLWYDATAPRFALGAMPGFLVDRAEYPAPLYGFPNFGEGVKAALHGFGPAVSPAAVDRSVTNADRAALEPPLEAWMPGTTCSEPGSAGASRFVRGKVCLYALTPDEDFVVGAGPAHADVFVFGGFSGHGFKFAPVIGEIGASLLSGGTVPPEAAFLSPRRFAGKWSS